MKLSTSKQFGVGGAITFIAFVFTMMAGFITHIVWILTTLTSSDPATVGQIVLAILGLVAPPLGAIHGIFLWF